MQPYPPQGNNEPTYQPGIYSTSTPPETPPPPPVPPKKSKKKAWIIAGVVILFIALLGFYEQTMNPTGNTASTDTSSTPTQAASTPAPTDTPVPTAKPTATMTVAQNVQATAQGNATLDDKVTTQYDDGSHSITVTVTLSEAINNDGYKLAIRDNCFNINKAEYHNIHGLTQVTINFLGPMVDQYGNKSTGGAGQCTLTNTTESKFNWGNLDPDTTWNDNDYDSEGYAQALQ